IAKSGRVFDDGLACLVGQHQTDQAAIIDDFQTHRGVELAAQLADEGGAEAPPALPEPAEFAADVDELAAYAKTVEDRAKATEARRKLAGLGA
ncbi:MAG: hypothetical protein K2Q97_20610, partial [Burkholderiaceae bacterium]|nr:hypothetical protein [Burkholderiaceae bacterium]